MAFDAGYADKINNALEEYRQDESEMRQNAPGAENFNTEAESPKKPEIKKEPVDGSVEITFDPDGMTANMILHKAYNRRQTGHGCDSHGGAAQKGDQHRNRRS